MSDHHDVHCTCPSPHQCRTTDNCHSYQSHEQVITWMWLCYLLWNNQYFITNLIYIINPKPVIFYYSLCQPRWLSGLRRSRVHSLWLLVDHCVLRNWDRILVRAVKGLISRAGMVSICPLLWQRDVKLQQTNKLFPMYNYHVNIYLPECLWIKDSNCGVKMTWWGPLAWFMMGSPPAKRRTHGMYPEPHLGGI